MDEVTGSFGYIGKYITRELLERGRAVKTVTTHPEKPELFGGKVEATSYLFEDPEILTRYLEGTEQIDFPASPEWDNSFFGLAAR